MAVEKVGIRVEADLTQLKSGLKEAGNIVDSEKARLQSKTAINMSLNLANLRTQLREINELIKQAVKDGDRAAEIKFRANATLLQKEITKANRELLNFTRTGDKNVSALSKLFDGVKTSFSGLGGVLAGAFSVTAIANFTKKVFTLTSQNQQLANSFTVLTKSEETSLELLKQIDSFAKQTPFNKLQIAENAQKLLAFGFEANKVVNVLQSIGNAVSAVGGTDETLSAVIRALGQMQTKGKLVQQEVNQIAETGIPIFK
nr:tape measure protein [Candidatus Gracilibacteria bacterium]